MHHMISKHLNLRKLPLLILTCIFAIQAYGQSYFRGTPQINENVINRISSLFYREQYKECIDSCKHYIRYNYDLGYEKHPYRDWTRNYFKPYGIDELTEILYFGTVSAYKYSLIDFDTESIFDGMRWARACANICSDYLQEESPKDYWSAEMMSKYVLYGEKGVEVSQCGEHFLHIMGSEKWAKKEEKWFDKTGNTIYETIAKKLTGFESKYSMYPLLQYKITNICTAPSLNKGILKDYTNIFTKRLSALSNLIENNENNTFDTYIHIALKSLTSMLTNTVIEGEICKRIGGNYERFCMENLIKLQDISYNLSGSSRYSQNPDYTLQDIQNNLEDTDCAIVHFEAPVASGHYYFRYDLGTRYRNYALIITKDQVIPDVWHRGYINDNKVNDLSKIKESYPNAKRFYFVGTPRMSFIDIAETDASIIRLHSLSQLLQNRESRTDLNEVTFIGDIFYWKLGATSQYSDKKGGSFNLLRGPAIELKQIKALNKWNLRPVRGDDATRNVVASEISRSKSIIHISTHGELFNFDDDFSPQDLILKKNVMDNSRLILSGYNDSPKSPLTSISGSDVLKIKRIETPIVFLDACSSGRGAVGASGSVGISEAFHLIGAKKIICYLEPVEDEVATEFSNMFYKELANGASCHDAFFNAKKSLNSKIKVVLWE